MRKANMKMSTGLQKKMFTIIQTIPKLPNSAGSHILQTGAGGMGGMGGVGGLVTFDAIPT